MHGDTSTGLVRLAWGRAAWREYEGAGTPLIFLHGTGCELTDWAAIVRCLPPGRQALCVDFRGHGASDAPAEPFTLDDLADDVRRLLAERHAEASILVGHSLGGMVAMAVAARAPQLRGLILLEGWTSLSVVGRAFDAATHMYGGLPASEIAAIHRKSVAMRARMPPAVWKCFWDSVEAFDGWPFLTETRLPVLEIYGDAGRRDGTREALRIPQSPAIALEWVAGAGHYLPRECPAAMAALITAFAGSGG